MATMVLSVPNSEISLFKQLISKLGWKLEKEISSSCTSNEMEIARKRSQQLDYFIEAFRTEELKEADVLAEVEAVRKEMYEAGQQKD